MRNYTAFFSLIFISLLQATEWHFPENKVIPTVFFQGVMDSHKQCAKYCGPKGFHALTGEHISCPDSIELIHTPFIGKELDEIVLQKDSDRTWYHPMHSIDTIQRYAFARQLARYNYQVAHTTPATPTVTAHAVDFFKLNFAQEGDIAECSQKVALADVQYQSKDKILWGVSRGAAAVFNAHAAHNYEGVRMIVLEGCFDTISHTIAARAPALLQKTGITKLFERLLVNVGTYRKEGINPLIAIDNFPEGVPVVFITSKADRSVPFDCTKEVIKKLKERGTNPVHVLVLKEAGHNHYALGNGQDQQRYLRFMHRLYKKYNLPYVPEYLLAH